MSKALCGGVEGLEHFKGWALKPLWLGERAVIHSYCIAFPWFLSLFLPSLARRCVPTFEKDKEARELVALVEQHKAEVQREKDSGTDSRPSQCVCQLPLNVCMRFRNRDIMLHAVIQIFTHLTHLLEILGVLVFAWLAWSVLVWDPRRKDWRPRQRHRHCAACKSSLFLRLVFWKSSNTYQTYQTYHSQR